MITSHLNSWNIKTTPYLTLEIHVLALDRHINAAFIMMYKTWFLLLLRWAHIIKVQDSRTMTGQL
jgi:hypothetical protein